MYQFGKDFNGVLTLPELETLDLSYNTISCLDDSLVFTFATIITDADLRNVWYISLLPTSRKVARTI